MIFPSKTSILAKLQRLCVSHDFLNFFIPNSIFFVPNAYFLFQMLIFCSKCLLFHSKEWKLLNLGRLGCSFGPYQRTLTDPGP